MYNITFAAGQAEQASSTMPGRNTMKMLSAVVLSTILHTSLAFGSDAPKTPEAVIDGLIEEVRAPAGKYPELADFPEYAKQRKKESAEDAEKDARVLDLTFIRKMGEITVKRGIRPSDFGKNGICLKFELAPASDFRPAEIDTITELRQLKLTLFAEVHLSENPSPGLEEKLRSIVQRHRQRLVELDKQAADMPGDAEK